MVYRIDAFGESAGHMVATTARRFWREAEVCREAHQLVRGKGAGTIVGVVSDVRAYYLQRSEPDCMRGTLYVPHSPKGTLEDGRVPAEMTIAVRTTSDESEAGAMLRRIVTGLNQAAPVSEIRSMQAVMSEAVSTPASTTSLFVTFAALALVLGMIGIYGVLAFLVSKRTREIGIRMALGAQRRDVLWLVMKEGGKFSLAGIALGLAGAFAVTRLLSSELYGVSPVDPFTYAGVTFVMAMVTLLASYIPTRRAMRIDLIALRCE